MTALEEFQREFAAKLRLKAREPDIHSYVPHEKQKLFHANSNKKKLYVGGNRSGKTEGGVIEDIWWATGKHPNREVPPAPNYGRVVGVDFTNGIQKIILPKFKKRIPPSLLKNGSWEDSYSNQFRTLTLSNGSTIEFMSYDQDTDKFAGVARHWTHFDEEPPKSVFDECTARLIDYGGSWWLTMTPVEGITWVYSDLYKKTGSDIFVVEADMFDNPHIDVEAGLSFLSGLGTDDDRKARKEGKFIQLGGRVYAPFKTATHVIPSSLFVLPVGWEIYASCDHGFNNPTAWYWHAVGPNNEVVTFSEHYASEMTVEQHAAVVFGREAGFRKAVTMRVGDPAMNQRSAITGHDLFTEYNNYGIHIIPAPTKDVNLGVNRINNYLKSRRSDGLPYWVVTDNCPNLISELEHVHWETYKSKKLSYNANKRETIHKKDDHATDSVRYFFTLRPDMTPVGDEDVAPVTKHVRSETGRYDDLLLKSLEQTVTIRSLERTATRWNTEETYYG